MDINLGRGIKRIFLIFCLIIPLDIFGESITKEYGKWYENTVIDDFTDEKSIVVLSYDEEEKNTFVVKMREGQWFDFRVSVKSVEECAIFHDITIFMLFRVDKNTVLELPMVKYNKENPQSYGVNFELLQIQKKKREYLVYLEEMKKGKTFKIRIDDNNNGCKKDLTFDLNDFDKAIKQISDDVAKYTNLLIIQNELDKTEAK